MIPIYFAHSVDQVHRSILEALELAPWAPYVRTLGILNGRAEYDCDGYGVIALQGNHGVTQITVHPGNRLGPRAVETCASLVEWLKERHELTDGAGWKPSADVAKQIAGAAERTLASIPSRLLVEPAPALIPRGMKARMASRQNQIKELLKRDPVPTADEMSEILINLDFPASVSTVNRDLSELRQVLHRGRRKKKNDKRTL